MGEWVHGWARGPVCLPALFPPSPCPTHTPARNPTRAAGRTSCRLGAAAFSAADNGAQGGSPSLLRVSSSNVSSTSSSFACEWRGARGERRGEAGCEKRAATWRHERAALVADRRPAPKHAPSTRACSSALPATLHERRRLFRVCAARLLLVSESRLSLWSGSYLRHQITAGWGRAVRARWRGERGCGACRRRGCTRTRQAGDRTSSPNAPPRLHAYQSAVMRLKRTMSTSRFHDSAWRGAKRRRVTCTWHRWGEGNACMCARRRSNARVGGLAGVPGGACAPRCSPRGAGGGGSTARPCWLG